MKDGEIKKTGNSRFMRSLNMPDTYEEFKALLESGIFPFDLNGINPDGWKIIPDWLNKANLLSDATCNLYGIPKTSVPNDAFQKIWLETFPTIPNNLAKATPQQINRASIEGIAPNLWQIGDETSAITLTTGESITLQIAGFNHDYLSDGSGQAGITFIMKDCFNSRDYMSSGSDNTGGWEYSDLRTKMTDYLRTFPFEWQQIIKPVKKKTSAGNKSTSIMITNDYLWLPSYTEMNFGANTSYSPGGEGYAYPLFTDNTSRIKNVNGSAYSWWLRSPILTSSLSFAIVDYDGSSDSTSASYQESVVLGLCI